VLFFASAPGLDEALIQELAAHPSAEHLIVDLSGLGRIDFTGALVLKTVAKEAERAGLTMELAGVPPRLRPILSRVLEERKALLGSVEE
jgi:SulP family sulfate permease